MNNNGALNLGSLLGKLTPLGAEKFGAMMQEMTETQAAEFGAGIAQADSHQIEGLATLLNKADFEISKGSVAAIVVALKMTPKLQREMFGESAGSGCSPEVLRVVGWIFWFVLGLVGGPIGIVVTVAVFIAVQVLWSFYETGPQPTDGPWVRRVLGWPLVVVGCLISLISIAMSISPELTDVQREDAFIRIFAGIPFFVLGAYLLWRAAKMERAAELADPETDESLKQRAGVRRIWGWVFVGFAAFVIAVATAMYLETPRPPATPEKQKSSALTSGLVCGILPLGFSLFFLWRAGCLFRELKDRQKQYPVVVLAPEPLPRPAEGDANSDLDR